MTSNEIHPLAIKAALYRQAVLGAVPVLFAHDPQLEEERGNWNFGLKFVTAGQESIGLQFGAGQAAWETSPQGKGAATLFFLSDRHLVGLFEQRKWAVPLFLPGPQTIRGLFHFARLAKRLDHLTNPKSSPDLNPTDRQVALRVLLEISLRGSVVLSERMPSLTKSFPSNREVFMELGVKSMGYSRFLSWNGRVLRMESGTEGHRPSVRLFFRNEEVALAALSERLDPQAAVGLGDIEMEGFFPLADALNGVLSRLSLYLRPI